LKTINRQVEDEQSTEVPILDFPINLQKQPQYKYKEKTKSWYNFHEKPGVN